MFKLHLVSELKEAFITLKDIKPAALKSSSVSSQVPSPRHKMVINDRHCIGCGACAVVCPAGAISLSENRKHRTIVISVAHCIYCRMCVEACPEKVLSLLPGDDLTSQAKAHLQHELQIKLKRCEHCRTPMATQKSIAKVFKDVFTPGGLTMDGLEWPNLCPACRRTFHSSRLISQMVK